MLGSLLTSYKRFHSLVQAKSRGVTAIRTIVKSTIFKNGFTLISEIDDQTKGYSNGSNTMIYLRKGVRDEDFDSSGACFNLKNVLDTYFLKHQRVPVNTQYNRDGVLINYHLPTNLCKYQSEQLFDIFDFFYSDQLSKLLFHEGLIVSDLLFKEKLRLEKIKVTSINSYMDSNDFITSSCFGNQPKTLGMPFAGHEFNKDYEIFTKFWKAFDPRNLVVSISGLSKHDELEESLMKCMYVYVLIVFDIRF